MTSNHHSDPDSVATSNDIARHILGFAAGFVFFMIFIPAALLGLWLLEGLFSDFPLVSNWWLRIGLSGILFLWGMVFVVWSNLFLVSVGKGGPANVGHVVISPLTKKLVISGPYRYTRNPMVFGANSVYLAIAIYLDSWLGLAALILFFVTFVRTAIQMEEKRLENDFGAEFENYRCRTSLLIPLPPGK